MIKRSTGRATGVAAAVILILALVACGDNAFGPDPDEVEFAASLGIDLAAMTQTASGLYIRDDVVGTGEPAALLDTVTLTYTGWLVNGEVFDSGTLSITLGNPNFITGFTEGVTGMRVGGTRTIVIPANLAYGSSGADAIPDNAVLVFELVVTALLRAQT